MLGINRIITMLQIHRRFALQRRFVAKVDQLMALLDQLEAQLAASRATAEKLVEAVVAKLTANN
jgi:hypothetical protein